MRKIAFLTTFVFTAFGLSFAHADTACGVTGAITDFPSNVGTYPDGFCHAKPDFYQVTIYEIGLCTSEPSAPTPTTPLDKGKCQVIFTNSAGANAQVSVGTFTGLSGTFTRPVEDTYTHGYVVISSNFEVEASLDFGAAVSDGNGGNGRYCATANGNSLTDPTAVCDVVAPVPGRLVAPLRSFGGGAFQNTGSASFAGSAGSTVSINAYLMDSSGNLASAAVNVDKLVGIQNFSTPLKITEATTLFDLSIKVTRGMTIIDAAGDLQLDNGPFMMDINVQ